MSGADLSAILLTLQLAGATAVTLVLLSTPLAWWLAHTGSRLRWIVEPVVALPLVLPPTVLGFYLLILLGPAGALGGAWVALTGDSLAFSFSGLLIASLVYSLPFAVQPLQTAFQAVGTKHMEAAATLGASPLDAFLTVASPIALRGYLTAFVLTFAHTVGEFGVVLMVGGNIPERTRVISIAIFEHVETLSYGEAHRLSLGLLVFSFLVLMAVTILHRRAPVRAG